MLAVPGVLAIISWIEPNVVSHRSASAAMGIATVAMAARCLLEFLLAGRASSRDRRKGHCP